MPTIIHDGGEYPGHPQDRVRVHLRIGENTQRRAEQFRWVWTTPESIGDIMSYEITTPHDQSLSGLFIAHDGLPYSGNPSDIIEVRLRGGGENKQSADWFCWPHDGSSGDIISYCVVEPEQTPALAKQNSGEGYAGDLNDKVNVKFRGGSTITHAPAHAFRWTLTDSRDDIVEWELSDEEVGRDDTG